MNILSVFTLLGGLAFFLYGMNIMSSGLETMAGGKLERMLKKMTSNPFKSLLLGAGITIAIQSSSAMTVMLVGLVNSGIMELGQTIGVIMGSNIGTTLTAWILSLAGIESDNIWINLLKPESFSPIFALIGIILMMTAKNNNKKKSIGSILIGFAVLMYGMELMKDAMAPLSDMPEFASILTAFNNPILGVVFGAVFTGVIQSSAASVGILQALSLTGSITYGMALPIIMGQNIGTCVTALISSIGVNKNAKRVSVVHISFNLIGTIFFLSIFYGLDAIFHFSFTDLSIDPFGIAVVHTIFNVATTLILLPFTKLLEKIARFVIPDKETEKKEEFAFIDERLLSTPSVAIAECNNKSIEMANIARKTIIDAISLLNDYSSKKTVKVLKNEDNLDMYEDKLGTCLVKLSSREISDEDSRKVSRQLHTIGNFERIGDHAVNLLNAAQEIHDKDISFSDQASVELDIVTKALCDIINLTIDAYTNNDLELAAKVEPLEQVIDDLIDQIKFNHINRLKSGNCTIEMGFVLSDLLTNYERVSDHCSNIAGAMLELSHNSFEVHDYLNKIKDMNSPQFTENYKHYLSLYNLN